MKSIYKFILILLVFSACTSKQKENIVEEDSIKASKVDSIILSSGELYRVTNFPSKFVRDRNVDIWLPDSYSENEKYAVLYMHDGQMLFDSTKTWNKQEWKVDEILSQLQNEEQIKNTIVVAIWNHSDIRHTDYYPKKPFDLLPTQFKDSILQIGVKQFGTQFTGPNSDEYLKFIVTEVKPFIDETYSVYTDSDNTFIAGSSMGGLISMYALCEYPEVFGGAACLSTHWIGFMPQDNTPVPATFFTYLDQNLPSPQTHKVYFDYGNETLDAYYVPYEQSATNILKTHGFDESNGVNLFFEGHDHSENSWNKRFNQPVVFLLAK